MNYAEQSARHYRHSERHYKNYREIIGNLNAAIDWACSQDMPVVYIKHNNITSGRTFKPGTRGEELVSELNIVSNFIFTKTRGSALTSEDFAAFISENEINEFYITGADAVSCVKSTCFNLRKQNYIVHVLSDCIVSYDMQKIDDMLVYYASKGCSVERLSEVVE